MRVLCFVMNESDIKIVSVVRQKLRFDKRMLLYVVFFCFSALMWFFNKLGEETNATIQYPITFINLPMQKVVVNGLPDNFDLSVHARGFDILRYKLGKTPEPVVINLSRLNHILAKESTMEFNLGTSVLFEEIRSQLPSDIELSMIQPDTIYFVFSNYGEKRVPVVPVLDLHFASQCRVDGEVNVEPAMVTVNGPDIILDTLQAVYTKPVSARKVTHNVRKNIELQPIEGLALIHHKVKVEVPVSKFTESLITVPITVKNDSANHKVKLMPNEAVIRFWVSINDFSRINQSDFKVEVDASQIDSQIGLQLPVDIPVMPQNVFNVQIDPKIVNFVIESR